MIYIARIWEKFCRILTRVNFFAHHMKTSYYYCPRTRQKLKSVATRLVTTSQSVKPNAAAIHQNLLKQFFENKI